MYGDELGLTSEDDADYVRPTGITLSSLNHIDDPLSTNDNSSAGIYCTNLNDQVRIYDKISTKILQNVEISVF